MKPFEFVLIVVSVIVGLALTEFATGVADMIKNYRTAIFYWPHAVLCLWGFISFLNYWSTVYKLRRITHWTVPSIGIMIISALLYFVTTRAVFPDNAGPKQNYEEHFNQNIGTILALAITFNIFYMLESLVIRKIRKMKRYWTMIIFLLVMLSGVVIDNNAFRGILMVVGLTLQIYYLYSAKVIIQDEDVNVKAGDAERKSIFDTDD